MLKIKQHRAKTQQEKYNKILQKIACHKHTPKNHKRLEKISKEKYK
jgi:hypothetical protein